MSRGTVALGLLHIEVRGQGDGEKSNRLSWLVLRGYATLQDLVLLMPVIGFEIPALLLCLV